MADRAPASAMGFSLCNLQPSGAFKPQIARRGRESPAFLVPAWVVIPARKVLYRKPHPCSTSSSSWWPLVS